ncbi:CRISPR-associated exonuclease Cas4 [Nonomuraea muscovyensis]|uniref:CRISPR-associated exonuclease Cas4 n=1 Tax=Nonomuraea muscovyensis TaxID=1124761 RepID=A0A7X0CB60_9ACTN|nr:CRISPR-associated protein Cas4 [Nonomuraea muscovyensis]MBB6350895.1 CRISPR-associated exonuclease Cas4 [Nonomuraea muscovyensis]
MTDAAPQAGGVPLQQVMLSALEHHAYCPRQAGLILLEDGYADDASTIRGTLMHQRVHEPGHETRGAVRTLRALPVWHDGLALVGVCDVVEIHSDGRVIPIEHKSGSYTQGGPADVQVTGQAMCLEAMFSCSIPYGVIYSAADRRRHTVALDAAARNRVLTLADEVRHTLAVATLPGAVADQRCRRCSMHDMCMPRVLARQGAITRAASKLFTPQPEAVWDD